jgi:hypothetical protein
MTRPDDPFPCIFPLDPADLVNGVPRAVEGCPAHWVRYVFQQVGQRIFGCCDLHGRHCEPPGDLCCADCAEAAHDTLSTRHADGSRCVMEESQ